MADSGKRRKRLLVNISISLLTITLLFGIAEVSCRLFWEDEISNDDMDGNLYSITFGDLGGSFGTGYLIKNGLL